MALVVAVTTVEAESKSFVASTFSEVKLLVRSGSASVDEVALAYALSPIESIRLSTRIQLMMLTILMCFFMEIILAFWISFLFLKALLVLLQ